MEANPNQQPMEIDISENHRHRSTSKDFTFLGIFLLPWVVVSICSVVWYATHMPIFLASSLTPNNRLLRISRSARRTLTIMEDGIIEEGISYNNAKARLQLLDRVAPSKTLKDWLISLPVVHSHLVEYSTQSLIWWVIYYPVFIFS